MRVDINRDDERGINIRHPDLDKRAVDGWKDESGGAEEESAHVTNQSAFVITPGRDLLRTVPPSLAESAI